MPYWDHKGETQGIASPLCGSYNKGKCQVCLYDGPGFSLLCDPPPRLSEKSRRELKSLYPTTGETTNFQSSEGVLLLLRQSPPHTHHHKCLQGYFRCIRGASRVFACNGVFRVHLGCLPAMVYSGRISGVCLQWCIQGASQVFACKGVFGAHLRCLQLTGTVIGHVSA